MKILLDAYLLDRAIHELRHEIESRPSWVELPLRGILQMLSDEEAAKILRTASEKAKIETRKKLAKIISEVEQKTEQMTKETEQLVKEAKEKTRTIAKERRK